MEDDEFTLDEVTLWDGGPVPPDRITVRGAFDEIMCVRCVLEPQDAGALAQTYVCFQSIGCSDETGRTIMQITGARTPNLWYRVGSDDARTLHSVEDLQMLRSLEQVLAYYEQEKKERMQ